MPQHQHSDHRLLQRKRGSEVQLYKELGALAVLRLLPGLRSLMLHPDGHYETTTVPIISEVSLLTQLTKLHVGVNNLDEAQIGCLATSFAAIHGLLDLRFEYYDGLNDDLIVDYDSLYSSFSRLGTLNCLTTLTVFQVDCPQANLPRHIATSCLHLKELNLLNADIESAAEFVLLLKMPSLVLLVVVTVSGIAAGVVSTPRSSGLHLVITSEWERDTTEPLLLPLVGTLTYTEGFEGWLARKKTLLLGG